MKVVVLILCAVLGLPVAAQQAAHVHGLVMLNVGVDGGRLTLQLAAPLDSLLGFEHRPRTAAQRQAADALLKRLQEDRTLIRPAAAAQCMLGKITVESAALQSPAPAAGAQDSEHADLDASFEFNCRQPALLSDIELGLFDAFKRIQKIEVQVAGASGQFKQTLARPNGMLRLQR